MNHSSRLLSPSLGAPRRRHGARLAAAPVPLLLALAGALALGGCANLPAFKGFGKLHKPETTAETQTPAPDKPETPPAIAEPGPVPEPQETPKPGKLYEWDAQGRAITHVVINTDDQKARFYAGEEQVGWSMIASGLPSHATPNGEFAILEKTADKRSNLYGRLVNAKGGTIKGGATSRDRVPAGARFQGAAMPHFMRMTFDGVGMHAGPIPHPGRPASHGCIRMPPEIAAKLFKAAPSGTRVTVQGSTGPDYGNYVARVQQEQAAAAKQAVAGGDLGAEGGAMEPPAARRTAKVTPKRPAAARPAKPRTSVARAAPAAAKAQPASAAATPTPGASAAAPTPSATTVASPAPANTPAANTTASPVPGNTPPPTAAAAAAAASPAPASAAPAPTAASPAPSSAPAAPTAATPTLTPVPAGPASTAPVTVAAPSPAPAPARPAVETTPQPATPAPAPAVSPTPPPAAAPPAPAPVTPPAAPTPAAGDSSQAPAAPG